MRFHATNLDGMGSRRLAEDLLPHLFKDAEKPSQVFLKSGDPLGDLAGSHDIAVTSIKRTMVKPISRLIEVTMQSAKFDGAGNLLVLGDLPLASLARQTVLVHNPFLIANDSSLGVIDRVKFSAMRAIFARNHPFAKRLIVQTDSMKQGLCRRYGIDPEKITIIGQPPPEHLRQLALKRGSQSHREIGAGLKLFYPSRFYPHKNHSFLDQGSLNSLNGLVDQIVLTIEPDAIATGRHRLLNCIGEVDLSRVGQEYSRADALLFLSGAESYGLPLLEALWLDLPVICPDLPYARDILGANPHFYEAGSRSSFIEALARLKSARDAGWRADWSERRRHFPQDWQEVAAQFSKAVNI